VSFKTEPLGSIRFLTIHCSASPIGRGDCAANVMQWDIARFGQPSYHWIIEESGNKVRCLPDTVKGVHVALNNSHNIGVCYIGGVDKNGKSTDTRTIAQKKSLQEIVNDYRKQVFGLSVLGHRDWPNVNKACPCFDVATGL
jgi:N-acetylmuramoyl-L-alanine amidase